MKLVVNSRIDTAKFKKRLKGQMTIEFVVCFPVMLVVALIAVNTLLFFW